MVPERVLIEVDSAYRCAHEHCNTYLDGIRIATIKSFKGKFAEPILQGRMVPKGFPANLAKAARRKLIMVDAAAFLETLNSPPGNRLETLKGDLAGKHSIRVNDQWRVVFRWTDAGPEDVEIIDYH
jgi:proteic killer suppression protein